MNTTAKISKSDIIKIINDLADKAVGCRCRGVTSDSRFAPKEVKAAQRLVNRWEEKQRKVRSKIRQEIYDIASKARTAAALGELKPLKALIEKLRALGEH